MWSAALSVTLASVGRESVQLVLLLPARSIWTEE